MTRVSTHDSAGSVPVGHPTDRRKAVLFCPRCRHESGVDGDWVVTIRENAAELRCPDCRELLTRRWLPAKERSGPDR
jgi:predicted RNA-binding Zn-ribbon protein involved in translation (DUF1610 family)